MAGSPKNHRKNVSKMDPLHKFANFPSVDAKMNT